LERIDKAEIPPEIKPSTMAEVNYELALASTPPWTIERLIELIEIQIDGCERYRILKPFSEGIDPRYAPVIGALEPVLEYLKRIQQEVSVSPTSL
jgi:hypothetical protein